MRASCRIKFLPASLPEHQILDNFFCLTAEKMKASQVIAVCCLNSSSKPMMLDYVYQKTKESGFGTTQGHT
jgi:hypothetical protein